MFMCLVVCAMVFSAETSVADSGGPGHGQAPGNPAATASSAEPAKSHGPTLAMREIRPEGIRLVESVSGIFLRLCGGSLAGLLLLIIAWQRDERRAGIVAAFAAVLMAFLLGSIGSLAVGAWLWIYLRRRPLRSTGEAVKPSPWKTFGIMLLLMAMYLGLQILAILPALIAPVLELRNVEAALEKLIRDGRYFQTFISASWITVLGLVAICGGKAGVGKRLGLERTDLKRSIFWTGILFLVVAVVGALSDHYLDEHSSEAMKAMSLAKASPVVFVLALCVFGPTVEELIFRGYLYSCWVPAIGWWVTMFVTSFFFMTMHVQYGWVGFAYAFAMGVILSTLRRLTGSVIPCIVLHAMANGVSVIQAFVGK